MKPKIRRAGQGILIDTGNAKYALDKVSRRIGADFNLITHAHIDHLPRMPAGKVYATRETLYLAKLRGYEYLTTLEDVKDIDVVNSGHILGSSAFLIEGKILYTGDINLNDRIFLRGFRPPKCDYLIIEATYGDPIFRFGNFNELLDKLLKMISAHLIEGRNIVIEAFPLGKLQLILHALRWVKNVYLSNTVYKYATAYRELGYLKTDKVVFKEDNISEPFILLTEFIRENSFITPYNPVRIKLSGWMARIRSQTGLPISDHADYNDLIKTVETVEPKHIYVAYGFSKKFSEILRNRGYEAEPLL